MGRSEGAIKEIEVGTRLFRADAGVCWNSFRLRGQAGTNFGIRNACCATGHDASREERSDVRDVFQASLQCDRKDGRSRAGSAVCDDDAITDAERPGLHVFRRRHPRTSRRSRAAGEAVTAAACSSCCLQAARIAPPPTPAHNSKWRRKPGKLATAAIAADVLVVCGPGNGQHGPVAARAVLQCGFEARHLRRHRCRGVVFDRRGSVRCRRSARETTAVERISR
jgi:hypothetical protein